MDEPPMLPFEDPPLVPLTAIRDPVTLAVLTELLGALGETPVLLKSLTAVDEPPALSVPQTEVEEPPPVPPTAVAKPLWLAEAPEPVEEVEETPVLPGPLIEVDELLVLPVARTEVEGLALLPLTAFVEPLVLATLPALVGEFDEPPLIPTTTREVDKVVLLVPVGQFDEPPLSSVPPGVPEELLDVADGALLALDPDSRGDEFPVKDVELATAEDVLLKTAVAPLVVLPEPLIEPLLNPLSKPLLLLVLAGEDGAEAEDGLIVAVELGRIDEKPVTTVGEKVEAVGKLFVEDMILEIEDEVVRIEDEVVVGLVLVLLVVLGVEQLPAWVDVTEPVSVFKTVLVTVEVARLIVVDAVKAGVGGAVVVVITLIV
ncbi:MAG: hypothetical protein LQ347_004820 [Umbilicaria vellea]|nr:MAG: hypothetical protein LQ347_004820 [Umbilicaria vellea]